MDRMLRRPTILLAAALLIAAPSVTAAQDDPLDPVLAAVGGADALRGLTGFTVEASGERGALDEGQVPGGPAGLGGSFGSVATIDVAGDDLRIDYEIAPTEFGPPRTVSEIVTGDIGYVDGQNSIVAPPGASPLLSDRVASIRIHQQLLNPPLLLLDALSDPSIASIASQGLDAVEIAHGPTPITLWIDPTSGEIARATTMESNPLRRDVELEVTYSHWTETDSGVLFPGGVTIRYDGEIVHDETRSIATDEPIDPAIFAIPDGVEPVFDAALAERGDVNHQYLQSFEAIGFPLDGRQLDIVAAEILPGIHHVTGGSHHSLVVVQDEGVVIVEAPLDETRMASLLTWLETVAPDMPVTHVVQSHHHVDHSGGLRYLAGTTGATAVVGEVAVPFYTDRVFGAASEIVPDGIDGSAIETVGVGAEALTLGSGTNPVSVYSFPNPHAEDNLLVEAGGALWVVVIYNPGLGFGAPPPELFAFVEAQGIEVTQVVGGHGGIDAWADLVAP